MSFPAFIDTCALYSATLTDTLLRIAEERAFRPHWSAGVMTELANVLVREAGLSREQAAHRIAQMQRAFPAAEIIEYEPLIEAMSCDQKDRHVLNQPSRSMSRSSARTHFSSTSSICIRRRWDEPSLRSSRPRSGRR